MLGKAAHLIITLSILTIGLCNGQGNEDARKLDSAKAEFTTPIRPAVTTWSVTKAYTDTLVYKLYNDTYDLPIVLMTTVAGDSVILYFDASAEDNIIDNIPAGTLLEIKWEVGQFFEPWENGDPYFSESLLSYKILK